MENDQSMSISLTNIDKTFGGLNVFRQFNLHFQENRITAILGPSGCGKTTLLNMLAGVQKPDSGHIDIQTNTRISYLFQEHRLLPWRNIADNIALVLDDKLSAYAQKRIACKYLEMVGLLDFSHYYPGQLSGGMLQRASMARAFAFHSEVMLMDEPFQSLNSQLHSELINLFLSLWQNDKRTVIFVTHNPDEAVRLGHEIVVLHQNPATIKEHFTNQPENYPEIDDELAQKLRV
jgi:NitT/TauT family transport system ATP-binding protein